jgi:hypothetical protein
VVVATNAPLLFPFRPAHQQQQSIVKEVLGKPGGGHVAILSSRVIR